MLGSKTKNIYFYKTRRAFVSEMASLVASKNNGRSRNEAIVRRRLIGLTIYSIGPFMLISVGTLVFFVLKSITFITYIESKEMSLLKFSKKSALH